jgi:hypothetical protein
MFIGLWKHRQGYKTDFLTHIFVPLHIFKIAWKVVLVLVRIYDGPIQRYILEFFLPYFMCVFVFSQS